MNTKNVVVVFSDDDTWETLDERSPRVFFLEETEMKKLVSGETEMKEVMRRPRAWVSVSSLLEFWREHGMGQLSVETDDGNE